MEVFNVAKRWLAGGYFARAAILAISMTATAQGAMPGEVDPTFGSNGRTVVADNSRAIGLRLPDGSFLVASQTHPAADLRTKLELRRFDSDGHVDPGFGIAGVAHHEFADATDLAHSIARAAEGRVYFGGWTRKVRGDQGWLDMAVFAVDAQGGAIATFGDGGMASFDLANPRNSGAYDGASALAVMPDGRLLVGGFSANYYYDYPDPTRLSRLLWLNADGSLDRNVALDHATNVCHGIKGLLARTDGSLLVGDDTGIYAFVNDSVLQTFGMQGVAMNADFRIGDSGTHCFGLRSFAADPNGELLTVSEVGLPDGQLGFELRRLNENGTETPGSVRVPPVPLASLVRNDQRFVDSAVSIYAPSQMARPIQSGADGRLYLLFGFFWDEGASGEGIGDGWAIARFAADGTLDTGWGDSGVVVIEKGGLGYWDSVPTLLEPLTDGRIVALTPNGVLTRLLGGQREGHGAINIASGLDVVEVARQFRIEVTRTGGSAGAVSVEYFAIGNTELGPATSGEDFSTEDYGRLDWADGDTSPREIVFYIFEDTLKEGDEHFDIEIRSPLGGAVLLNTRARVRISDDGDTATPPPPPPVDPSGGGGAADGLTLIILFLLTALSVVLRISNHFFFMNPCRNRKPGLRSFYGQLA